LGPLIVIKAFPVSLFNQVIDVTSAVIRFMEEFVPAIQRPLIYIDVEGGAVACMSGGGVAGWAGAGVRGDKVRRYVPAGGGGLKL
jgi:hypothetical protein